MSHARSDEDEPVDTVVPLHTSSARMCLGEDCCKKQERESTVACDPPTIAKPLDSSGNGQRGPLRAASSLRRPRNCERGDVEEGLAYSERVTLQFQGSNCPGCASQISKALESISAIQNLQFNTILLRADFDLVKFSVRDVIENVRKATGRASKRIGDGWHELNITVLGRWEDFGAAAILLLGVKDVTHVDGRLFSVKYDASVIGARELLKSLNTNVDRPIELAPPKSYDELPIKIRATACSTSLSWVLTIPILVLAWAPLPSHTITYGLVALLLATLIQVVVGGPFYLRAFRSLILNQVIDLDLLVVLSTSIAYGFSVASFICQVKGMRLVSGIYFETSSLLITLIMTGRLMSDFACLKALRVGSIRSLQPQSALLVDTPITSIENELQIDVRLLQVGDVFRVNTGCPVATDGIIISGVSEFDESLLNGESTLVRKEPRSSVMAGSVSIIGDDVLVEVTKLPGNNTIDEIAEMVEEVTHSKIKVQQTADEVARWIVPISAMFAILTLLIWFTINIVYRGMSPSEAVLSAVPYTISVLVVSCPCALAFSVPMVVLIASRVGAKCGVLIRTAEAIGVTSRGVTHVVFDKTGTLTQSCLSVVSEEYFSETETLGGAIVVALARQSDHPVSRALLQHLQAASVESATVADIRSVVGKGIEGTYNGQTVRIGNARWLGVEQLSTVQMLLAKNLTVLCATQEDRLVAVFGLEASLRDEAKFVVSTLMKRGKIVSIISGDETGAVEQAALKLGISLTDIKARCTPQEKQKYVKELMDRNGTVLFCGDGINDAAALTQASVGVHMSNGPGTAWTAGDVALSRPSLLGILLLIDLSRDAWRQIIFNFCWAALYNIVAILFAAGAFVKVRLSPQYAGLGEAVSVLPVILVSLRLRMKQYL